MLSLLLLLCVITEGFHLVGGGRWRPSCRLSLVIQEGSQSRR